MMREAMEEQNPKLMKEMTQKRTLGETLKSKVESVMLQLNQMTDNGMREQEAFEVVRDQVLLPFG